MLRQQVFMDLVFQGKTFCFSVNHYPFISYLYFFSVMLLFKEFSRFTCWIYYSGKLPQWASFHANTIKADKMKLLKDENRTIVQENFLQKRLYPL